MTKANEERPGGASFEESEESPTDEDLDVEGPNEAAPGHEPSPDEGEADGGSSLPASDG